MTIEEKIQTDAIKGKRILYQEFGRLILLCDGKVGVYVSQKELKIDKTKMQQIENQKGSINLDPNALEVERTPAKETNTALKLLKGFAIKIKSMENDAYCFIQEKYLKMFKGYNSLYIKDSQSPILIKRYGVPYGIILPVYHAKELE